MSSKRTSKKTGAPKAPYESTHLRIPVPMKEQLGGINDWCKALLRKGVKAEKIPNLMEVFEWAERFLEISEKIDKLIEEQKKREDEVLHTGRNHNNHDSYEYYLNSKAYKETKETLLEVKKLLKKVNEKSFNSLPENVVPSIFQNQKVVNDFSQINPLPPRDL